MKDIKTFKNNSFPDITRPDSGIVLVSKWRVDDIGNQKIAGDAAIDIWEEQPWPEGLISHTVYLGHDGITVLQYSQWSDEEAIETFNRNNLTERVRSAYYSVPGLNRVEAVKYNHYRSMVSPEPSRLAGCIILVSFETDGAGKQRKFVDALIDTVESRENSHHTGSIASHFHLSIDGERVLNYAEFTSKEAHEEMVQTMLQEANEVPRLIRNMHGIKPLGFERFALYRNKSVNLKTQKSL